MTEERAGVDVSEMLTAALRYAANDWPPFPLLANDKTPATEHGFKDATTEEAPLRAMFAHRQRQRLGSHRRRCQAGRERPDHIGEA
jgi:hypothetical protein